MKWIKWKIRSFDEYSSEYSFSRRVLAESSAKAFDKKWAEADAALEDEANFWLARVQYVR